MGHYSLRKKLINGVIQKKITMDHSFTQQISVFMMCQAQGKEQSADTEDSVGDCGAPCL